MWQKGFHDPNSKINDSKNLCLTRSKTFYINIMSFIQGDFWGKRGIFPPPGGEVSTGGKVFPPGGPAEGKLPPWVIPGGMYSPRVIPGGKLSPRVDPLSSRNFQLGFPPLQSQKNITKHNTTRGMENIFPLLFTSRAAISRRLTLF